MSRDPNAIEREIEETRAELARTVDLIAERLSPKRVASRSARVVTPCPREAARTQ
jgi:hypothetical protein